MGGKRGAESARRFALYLRGRRRRLLAEGRCPDCRYGETGGWGHYCLACRDRKNKAQNAKRAALRAKKRRELDEHLREHGI